LGGEAGFELADFIGGADEQSIDGADASAHFIRRSKLHQCVADDDAYHVARAHQDQGQQRKYQAAGQSEDNGENAEAENAGEHGESGVTA
jgi:hypothetical protein